MKKNIGLADTIIRIIIAIIIGILIFANLISGALAIVLGVLAAVLMLTSVVSFCPLYFLLGINSCKK